METIQRHEDRRVSERQFHDMKSSMEYDNDWLLKMHRGTSSRMQLLFCSVFRSSCKLTFQLMYSTRQMPTDLFTKFYAIRGCDDCGRSIFQSTTRHIDRRLYFVSFGTCHCLIVPVQYDCDGLSTISHVLITIYE